MPEYKYEYLGSGIRVAVSKEHSFGTDAVLLADFASPKRNEKACDLGTGCGIIPMIWCRNGQAKEITAGFNILKIVVNRSDLILDRADSY